MNTVPLGFIPSKRRVLRKRKTAATSAGPVALQVVGVENVFYDEPLLSFTLVFNTTAEEPLVADTLDPEKWSGTYAGGAMTAYSAEVTAFDRILVVLQGMAGAGGPSTVSYAADPSDVSDTSGRELAAFVGLPL